MKIVGKCQSMLAPGVEWFHLDVLSFNLKSNDIKLYDYMYM